MNSPKLALIHGWFRVIFLLSYKVKKTHIGRVAYPRISCRHVGSYMQHRSRISLEAFLFTSIGHRRNLEKKDGPLL